MLRNSSEQVLQLNSVGNTQDSHHRHCAKMIDYVPRAWASVVSALNGLDPSGEETFIVDGGAIVL